MTTTATAAAVSAPTPDLEVPTRTQLTYRTAANVIAVLVFGWSSIHLDGLGATARAVLVGSTCIMAALLSSSTTLGLEHRRAARLGLDYSTMALRRRFILTTAALTYVGTFAALTLIGLHAR